MMVIITQQISCLRLSCSVFTDGAEEKLVDRSRVKFESPISTLLVHVFKNKAKSKKLMRSGIGGKMEFFQERPIVINVLSRELLTELEFRYQMHRCASECYWKRTKPLFF